MQWRLVARNRLVRLVGGSTPSEKPSTRPVSAGWRWRWPDRKVSPLCFSWVSGFLGLLVSRV